MRHLAIVLTLAVLLSGCATGALVLTNGPRTTSSAASGEAVLQAAHPVKSGRSANDAPLLAYVEGWGLVLATPRVLASFPDELRSAPGRNRTFEPCRRQIELAAADYDPVEIQAASLGPERHTGAGLYEGMIEIRIIYRMRSYHEVRQAALKCTARPDGSIIAVDEAPPADEAAARR